MDLLSPGLRMFSTGIGLEIVQAVNKFNEDTKGEDELQVILRGHLYIEHEIEKLLRLELAEPDYILKNNRLMFANKVNLAVALGLLPKNRKTMYEKLNSIRNNYAHQLDFELDEKHLNGIVSCMDKEVKDRYVGSSENTLLENMKCAISALWLDAILRVYWYRADELQEEMDRVDELYMMKENPLSDEELQKKSEEVMRKVNELFPD
ncbi:hypothetical protein [Bacillus cereus]|uniref:hypothetical protein n=1 Tax=Bacillus cereus TaxID=1396 RepID=UPI0025A15CAC|nr:hypothetical protein [Bacillus cereus]MDM5465464.1 hypothetical protein [Bacillus cereus]